MREGQRRRFLNCQTCIDGIGSVQQSTYVSPAELLVVEKTRLTGKRKGDKEVEVCVCVCVGGGGQQ